MAGGRKQPVKKRTVAAPKKAAGQTAKTKHRVVSVPQPASVSAGMRTIDYTLVLVILFLLAFGLIMLYSTSSYEAGIDFGDQAYYLKRQAASSVVGLVAMLIVALIPYGFWRKMAIGAYLGSLVLVISLKWLGRTVNGATRWIYIGPVSVQPAEASKLGTILFTALLIVMAQNQKRNTKHGQMLLLQTWRGLIGVMLPAVIQAGFIYVISNNLSSAMIVVAIAAGMVFVATRDYWRFFTLAGIVGSFGGLWIYRTLTSASDDLAFRSKRLLTWIDPTKYADDTGFQTLQALYGIGSGGIFGKGLGQSMQKLGYIPEAQNDMIFSIICEELGMFGAVCVIALFILLCWRLVIIATNADDLFGALIAVGVMTHIAVQVILNIAVVTNTIPNTGVTLPFVSYGGSSILFLLAEMGLVISISRSRIN